ncbi:sugar ABC transporter substrate-binding protein [Paenibacillus lycopersici]|uniref:Sugar ABC transporter substrate-binding protein n=1 Tax=Paenibacillus lycopersici TaxID=2704462 RepID=A0A6C0G3P8_9BACL|nr:substrate-binding domain-containing protein [Paenibacillus lycopersici]QHT59395.1 sugar ABC transporter substrate-binding protein [Paenibacillus lycopersici]
MKNRIWNGGLILLALLFAGLFACFATAVAHTRDWTLQLKPASTAPGEDGKRPPRVALIAQVQNNPFWRSVEEGAASASKRFGMELEYMGPFRVDPAEQKRLLEKAIAERFDALLVQGQNDPSYARLIDQAAANGIPVIAVDADEPGSERLAYVGTDNRTAGRRMGELVLRAVGETGKIGVLIGSQASNQQLRLAGFRDVVKRHPGLTVEDVRSSNTSRLQAEEQAEDMLRRHPDLKAIVGFSALDGLGIAEAAKRMAAGNVLVFGFDDPGSTRDEIRGCQITAALVQQPSRMGEEAVTLIHDHLRGRKPEELHFTGTTVLDRASLAAEDAGAASAGNAIAEGGESAGNVAAEGAMNAGKGTVLGQGVTNAGNAVAESATNAGKGTVPGEGATAAGNAVTEDAEPTEGAAAAEGCR